jgi:hypothetical protein
MRPLALSETKLAERHEKSKNEKVPPKMTQEKVPDTLSVRMHASTCVRLYVSLYKFPNRLIRVFGVVYNCEYCFFVCVQSSFSWTTYANLIKINLNILTLQTHTLMYMYV